MTESYTKKDVMLGAFLVLLIAYCMIGGLIGVFMGQQNVVPEYGYGYPSDGIR